jgi:Zn-dependent protease with chaperone function
MHLIIILTSLVLAVGLRLKNNQSSRVSWVKRWQIALFFFVFPPLLLLMTAFAVIGMGSGGQMLGIQASWVSYAVAVSFLIFAGALLLKLTYQGYTSIRGVNSYSQQLVLGKQARIIDLDFPYSAQIGFWRSQLVISQGLLASVDDEHLEAILAHEQAHYFYRDTFWFFWLGWMRSFTSWLPNSKDLWQELLLLREMRADRVARKQVDSLLLAESLLALTKAPLISSQILCAAFSDAIPRNRLEERIDALLEDPEADSNFSWWNWSWMILALIPLLTVPLHY